MRFLTRAGLAITAALLLVAVVVSAVVLMRTGFFDFSSSLAPSDTEHFIALATALVGSAATVLAAVFVVAYNRRTHELAREAEKRANVEAAATFIALTTGKDGGSASPSQIAGAILSLIQLGAGHRRTALGVASLSLEKGVIDPASMTSILDAFIEGARDDELVLCAGELRSVAGDLARDEDFSWILSAYYHWPAAWPFEARCQVLLSIAKLLASKPLTWWVPDRVAWAALLAHEAASDIEPDEGVRTTATLLLDSIVTACEQGAPQIGELKMEHRSEGIAELRSFVRKKLANRNRCFYEEHFVVCEALQQAWNLKARKRPDS